MTKQQKAERDNAFLSMDRGQILAYEKKYIIPTDVDEFDDFTFWISIHKCRTALTSLPEHERRLSMDWLNERGFEHYAFDLDDDN